MPGCQRAGYSFIDALSDFPELEFHRVPTRRHNYHLLVARMAAGKKMRDDFMREMFHNKGHQVRGAVIPLDRYDFYRSWGFGKANCPNADAFFSTAWSPSPSSIGSLKRNLTIWLDRQGM